MQLIFPRSSAVKNVDEVDLSALRATVERKIFQKGDKKEK
jgi:hypothetical protein